MSCEHNWQCINSRPRGGYRLRRYECSLCGDRKSSIEIDLPDGKTAAGGYRGSVAKSLFNAVQKACDSEMRLMHIPKNLRIAIIDAETF